MGQYNVLLLHLTMTWFLSNDLFLFSPAHKFLFSGNFNVSTTSLSDFKDQRKPENEQSLAEQVKPYLKKIWRRVIPSNGSKI